MKVLFDQRRKQGYSNNNNSYNVWSMMKTIATSFLNMSQAKEFQEKRRKVCPEVEKKVINNKLMDEEIARKFKRLGNRRRKKRIAEEELHRPALIR
ncbi:hypothetical protein Tco_0916809 [Tanacetum coccineum]